MSACFYSFSAVGSVGNQLYQLNISFKECFWIQAFFRQQYGSSLLLSGRICGLHIFFSFSPFLFFFSPLLLLILYEITQDLLAWHNASKWEGGHFYYLNCLFYISAFSSRQLKTKQTWQYGLIFCCKRCRIKSRQPVSHLWNGAFALNILRDNLKN